MHQSYRLNGSLLHTEPSYRSFIQSLWEFINNFQFVNFCSVFALNFTIRFIIPCVRGEVFTLHIIDKNVNVYYRIQMREYLSCLGAVGAESHNFSFSATFRTIWYLPHIFAYFNIFRIISHKFSHPAQSWLCQGNNSSRKFDSARKFTLW